jgi:cell wall-associated NlpC family hydrolase
MKKLTPFLLILLLTGCASIPVYKGGGVSCRGPMPFSTGNSEASATGPPNPSNSIEQRMQGEIDSWMGTPYVYGGVSKSGVDCSGFTQAVFRSIGIEIPRRASRQAADAETVGRNNLQYGDLVFFNTSGSGISHCGIYLGNGEFVHSSSSRGVVRDLLSHPYYASRFVSAGRYL